MSVDKKGESSGEFQDPASGLWVWSVYLILFIIILPIWPVTGLTFGLPSWVVLTVLGGVAISLFTLYVLTFIWKEEDPDVRS